jgi:hypothetical protein
MRLVDIVVEASRTGDNPRLNRTVATRIIRAVAEWLDENPSQTVAASDVLRRAL